MNCILNHYTYFYKNWQFKHKLYIIHTYINVYKGKCPHISNCERKREKNKVKKGISKELILKPNLLKQKSEFILANKSSLEKDIYYMYTHQVIYIFYASILISC